jgi:hypothetical protein
VSCLIGARVGMEARRSQPSTIRGSPECEGHRLRSTYPTPWDVDGGLSRPPRVMVVVLCRRAAGRGDLSNHHPHQDKCAGNEMVD